MKSFRQHLTESDIVTYHGTIEAMIAEVGALDMGAEWFKANKFKWAVLPTSKVLSHNYDTEFCKNRAEAKSVALDYKNALGGKISEVV